MGKVFVRELRNHGGDVLNRVIRRTSRRFPSTRRPPGALAGVAASLRSAGHKPAARAYDALIAATAVAHDLPLYTCNPADFAGIDQLTLRAVTHPG